MGKGMFWTESEPFSTLPERLTQNWEWSSAEVQSLCLFSGNKKHLKQGVSCGHSHTHTQNISVHKHFWIVGCDFSGNCNG